MENIFESFSEYLQLNESISDLKKYLSKTESKKLEELKSTQFSVDFIKYNGESNYGLNEFKEYVFKIISNAGLVKLNGELKNKLAELPTWFFCEFENTVQNQWLIHFADLADEIEDAQKFKYGVSDFKKLGLTTYISSSEKKQGGYNFAFDLNDYIKYGKDLTYGGWHYGNGVVIFKAKGLKVWHITDQQHQVIFVGDTATNINAIIDNLGEWTITDKNTKNVIKKFNTLEESVDWFVVNYSKYKKQLY